MTINFQRLLDVAKATELLPLGRFDMGSVCATNSCGTAGCMIGNYNALCGRDKDTFAGGDDLGSGDWEHFGITANEYYWLFSWGVDFGWDELELVNPLKTDWERLFFDLEEVSREQALSRLRKFIYFKLHKHEMCHDERYGVSDRGRRAEGNQNFAARAKAKAAELATASA